MLQIQESNMTIDGETIARYFKYFLQQKNPYIVYKLNIERVASKGIYNLHKRYFDKLSEICKKYHIDAIKYLDFFINKLNKFEKDIDTQLVTTNSLMQYAEYLQIKDQQQKIYKNFIKSSKFIATECIKLHYNTAADYILHLIKDCRLAAFYLAGKISAYYLAAIPNFKKIYEKLDTLSKDEFLDLYNRYDKYHYDVNEAFLRIKNIKISPLKHTNELILKLKKLA